MTYRLRAILCGTTFRKGLIGIFMLATTLLSSCEYQLIHERSPHYSVAKIPVKLNWAFSGFEVDSKGFTKQSSTSIHRVTLRFFPKNGDPIFERYIGDGHSINEGFVDVPVGQYSVLIMNESISDSYWEGTESGGAMSIGFENVDDYHAFSAYVKTQTANPSGYYWGDATGTDYLFINAPLRLSTWSLDDFTVTQAMVDYSHYEESDEILNQISKADKVTRLSKAEEDMYFALTADTKGDTDGLNMRKLTYDVEIKLQVHNLTSVSEIKGGMMGFTNKVNMRTGVGYREPGDKTMIQFFTFNGRSNWYDDKGEYMGDDWRPVSGMNIYKGYTGQTSVKFLSFGRDYAKENEVGANPVGLYNLDLDFLYISGELLDKANSEFNVDLDNDPQTPYVRTKLPFDLTTQAMKSQLNIGTSIDIDMLISTIEVEYQSGTISVDEWQSGGIVDL